MMANEKSKAEQYRDERKARIAQTAKKNAKNMEKTNTAKKLAGRIVAIVVAAAIVLCALGFSLSYYGVPQRMISIGGVGSDQHVSIAEYEYYYMQSYNRLTSYAQYYSSYGYDYGYNTSLTPENQTKTTKDADGNEITWVEYLHDNTIQLAQMYKAYYNEALKVGLEIDEADKASIDDTIQNYKDEASGKSDDSSTSSSSVKYSLNAYLRKVFGGSVNERFLRKQLKIQTLAQKYYETRTDELKKGYTQEEIDKTYNADKDTYDMVDFRIYSFSTKTLSAEDNEKDADLEARQKKADAEVKSNAEAFYSAVTDETTFIAKATELNKDTADYDINTTKSISTLKADVTSNYNEDLSTWLFADTTKVGDKKLVTKTDSSSSTTTYYIALLTGGKHQSDTVTVHHILFMTVDSSSGKPLSDDKIAAAKQNAEDALKTWQEGEKTEDSFAALANKLSEDTGSNTKGGLYDSVRPGQMTTEFNDWSFDSGRQAGDVEIIETDYGYHVMYFTSKNGSYYDSAIRSNKASEDVEKEATELLEGDDYNVGFGPRRLDYAEKKVGKKIKNLIEISNANSTKNSTSK